VIYEAWLQQWFLMAAVNSPYFNKNNLGQMFTKNTLNGIVWIMDTAKSQNSELWQASVLKPQRRNA